MSLQNSVDSIHHTAQAVQFVFLSIWLSHSQPEFCQEVIESIKIVQLVFKTCNFWLNTLQVSCKCHMSMSLFLQCVFIVKNGLLFFQFLFWEILVIRLLLLLWLSQFFFPKNWNRCCFWCSTLFTFVLHMPGGVKVVIPRNEVGFIKTNQFLLVPECKQTNISRWVMGDIALHQ